jgi:hypothetical protein
VLLWKIPVFQDSGLSMLWMISLKDARGFADENFRTLKINKSTIIKPNDSAVYHYP